MLEDVFAFITSSSDLCVYVCVLACSCCPDIKFWKVGSRKLFAVRKGKGKKRKRSSSPSSSDLEEELTMARKIDFVHAKVSQLLEVNCHLPLPLGFFCVLYESFKCCICLASPLVPPAIAGKCCKRIIGCQKCVDGWYKSDGDDDRMTKKCPLCHGERGFADTMILHLVGTRTHQIIHYSISVE